MDVVILLVFISLVLVGGGLLLFVHRLREGDFDHGERLALTPLADDESPAADEAAVNEAPIKETERPESSSDEVSDLGLGALEGGTPHVKP